MYDVVHPLPRLPGEGCGTFLPKAQPQIAVGMNDVYGMGAAFLSKR